MQGYRFLQAAAIAFACLSLASSQEVIETANNCVEGAGEIVMWHIKDSGAKPAILMLPPMGVIRTGDDYSPHLVREALRYARMGYTVAAMNVFSTEKPNMADFSSADAAMDLAVNIKAGVDFMQGSDYEPWVSAGGGITVMGWGFGANGVLAAISHPVLGPMLKAGVAFTPDIAPGMRADLNVTGTRPELFVAVAYEHIDHLQAFEENMDAGTVKWEVSILSDTKMHFNVFGNADYMEEQTRRVTIATKHFMDNVVMGTTRGSQDPGATITAPIEANYFNYSIETDKTTPGVAIWDSNQATSTAKKPAIVIVPAWSGYVEYEIKRQVQLAKLGYVTMSANIYDKPIGHVVTPMSARFPLVNTYRQYLEDDKSNAAAVEEAGELFTDRIIKARDAVAALDNVDSTKIAMLGFCFGGTGVMNVFRYNQGGANGIQVGISMHGAMQPTKDMSGETALPGDYLLMVSGGNDNGESDDVLKNHLAELTTAAPNLDWEVMRFSKVDHGFSEWGGGSYNADAEGRGTAAMIDAGYDASERLSRTSYARIEHGLVSLASALTCDGVQVLANEWGMPTESAGCTATDACSCPGALSPCVATVLEDDNCPVPTTDAAAHAVPSLLMALGAVMASLALLF